MKDYKRKRTMHTVRKPAGYMHWDKWEKIVGDEWSLLELGNPTKLVIDDVMPRYYQYVHEKLPTAITESKADFANKLRAAVAAYPKSRLKDLDRGDEPSCCPTPESVKEMLDSMVESGCCSYSWAKLLLYLTPLCGDIQSVYVTPPMWACFCAYKATGADLTISKDNLESAIKYVMLAEKSGDKWSGLTCILLIAYLLTVSEQRKTELEELQAKATRAIKGLEELRAKEPEVKVVTKQVGQDKLDAAVTEVRKLRNEMASYKLGVERAVRDEYKDIISEKDTYIAELEARLAKEHVHTADSSDEDVVLPDVPESGVCIVGGRPGTRARIAEMYPGWSAFSRDTSTPSLSTKYGVIFTDFVSHSELQRFTSLNPDAKQVYVNSSNIQRMLLELRLAVLTE